MALFPSLNTQAGLAVDDETVRKQFALLLLIVEVIGLTSLLALPMLPRQKKETKEWPREKRLHSGPALH
jgi:hypothetical protein